MTKISNKKYITYMWREDGMKPIYWFQTTDPKIARRMQKRKDLQNVAIGWNRNIWIFKKEFYSANEAKRTLKRVTRSEIFFDPLRDEFSAISTAIVDIESQPQRIPAYA